MNKKTKGYIFIIISILCVVGMAFISFTLKNNARKAKKKEPWTFLEFLNNGETITYKTIFVGVSYGIIIGLVDVLGIWYVLKYLKVFMPKGDLLDAGIAEVYASVLAVIFGTFVSHAIKTVVPPDNTIPIWSDALGVLIGCLITLTIMTRTY
jgi:hypothetical protein